MRPKDTLRFLFPALFIVMALGALAAPSIFQFPLLGAATQESFKPAPVPSVGPESPSPLPPVAVVPPSPAPTAAPTAAPAPTTAPTAAASPATSPPAGGATAQPSADSVAVIISPLPGVIQPQPVDNFPFELVLGISTILLLIFCAIWLLYSRAMSSAPVTAPAAGAPRPVSPPAGAPRPAPAAAPTAAAPPPAGAAAPAPEATAP